LQEKSSSQLITTEHLNHPQIIQIQPMPSSNMNPNSPAPIHHQNKKAPKGAFRLSFDFPENREAAGVGVAGGP
jgi:hypothetical protein